MTFPTYHKIDTLFRRDDDHKLTDEFRHPVIESIRYWRVTEKIDGTNIRVLFTRDEGGAVSIQLGGRTDNAQIPAPLVQHILELNLVPEVTGIMEEHDLSSYILFGEGYGPKIQSGGDYRDDPGFILFDVRVGDFWLTDDVVTETADRLGIPRVPILGVWDLDEIVSIVETGFDSYCSVRPRPAEGIVARTIEPLYDQRGNRLIIKLKTKDFHG